MCVCEHVFLLETRRVTIVTTNNTVDQDDPKVTNIAATPRRMIFAAADDLLQRGEAITPSDHQSAETERKGDNGRDLRWRGGGGMAVMSHKN